MRTRSLRRVALAVLVAAAVAVGPAAALAQEPLPFTIDSARLAADRHTVVVAGTYTCPQLNLGVTGGGGTIDLSVTQGRIQGIGFVHLQGTVCDGTTHAWQVDVTTFGERRFQRGPARVSASGDVRGEDPSGQPVHLRVEIDRQPITITRL
jgi:hypothetical protein